ncbi:MAG: D-alanyl-D-alanine dipeptidase [Candidatus Pacebacteria bacterium CG10_big_fil_rev_8_21_14_0_10_42_12]|nr:MAG: D-alanyl-D-alanine dipeptidase [Candidatus Pacebacteria bacterium CG10_big_fil_rev_8_21_14_0_10_42_12]
MIEREMDLKQPENESEKDFWEEIYSRPIPEPKSTDGWQQVEIQDVDEQMISLSEHGGPRIVVRPAYYEAGFCNGEEEQMVRESLFYALQKAANALPEGYKLVILDGWRSIELQQEIYDRHYKSLLKAYPTLSPDELHELCQLFVSLPSDDEARPSPHYTGSAVDVTIQDEKGNLLWMGSEFDSFTEKDAIDYFENPWLTLSEHDKLAQRNRRLLYYVMVEVAGLIPNKEEWYHFDGWNQRAAKVRGGVAIHGTPMMYNNHP